MVKAFEAIAFPFIEEFGSLEALLAVLSRDDETAEALGLPLRRAQRALTVAYLLRDRSAFDRLVRSKSKWMADEELFRERDAFERFARDVAALWDGPTDVT